MRAEDAPASPRRSARSVPPGASVAADVARDHRGGARPAATRRCEEYEARFAGGETHGYALGPPLKVADAALEIALDGLDAAVRAGLEVAIANVRAVAEAGLDEDRAVDAARGPDREAARGPGPPRRDLRAQRPPSRIRPRS